MATSRSGSGYRLAVCAVAFLALLSAHSRAQNTPVQTPTPTQAPTQATAPAQTPTPDPARKALAANATAYVIKRERLDPNALVPDTHQPLGSRGVWGITTVRPATCPPVKDTDNCVRVVYRVEGTPVSCEWTVIINPDGTGAILEQNPDSVRYLVRVVPPNELAPLIRTRSMQLGTRAQGVVEVTVIVSPTGEPTNAIPISGPEPLRPASAEIAKQWVFKPLMVGNRAIPFMTTIKLTYGNGKIKSEP